MKLALRSILLFLACNTFAQINGGLPTPLQSATSGGDTQTSNATQMTNTVAVNDVIAGFIAWHDTAGSASRTVSDNCSGATYTMSSVISVTTATAVLYAQSFRGVASSSCRPTLTESPSIGSLNSSLLVADLGPNVTADGSTQSTTYTNVTTQGNLSTSVTSALNSDELLSFSVSESGHASAQACLPSAQFVASASGQVDSIMCFTNAGAAGSQTVTHQQDPTPNTQYYLMAVQAFKPTSHSIATTQLPEAANGVAYSATLVSIGGTTSPTWSNTAGTWPTGCSSSSINSSTGVISCTPTQIGTFSLTFSDGVASTTLSLKVDASFGLPTVGTPAFGSVNETWTLNGVFAGDTILLAFQGFNSSGDNGYIEPTSELSGTLGDTTYTRICPYPGGRMSGLAIYTGKTTTAGTDTITFNKQGVGSPIGSMAVPIHSAQSVVDCGAFNGIAKEQSTLSLTTQNYTAAVPNELLIAFGNVCQQASPATTLSINSPFTSLGQANGGLVCSLQQYSQQFAASTGTYTATLAATNQNTNNYYADFVSVFGVRAGPPSSPPFLGDKRRRVPR